MQTTLRIDDELYREAKVGAAQEGITLTRFLEEGLRLRLSQRGTAPRPTRLGRSAAAKKGSTPPESAEVESESFDASKWD